MEVERGRRKGGGGYRTLLMYRRHPNFQILQQGMNGETCHPVFRQRCVAEV